LETVVRQLMTENLNLKEQVDHLYQILDQNFT